MLCCSHSLSGRGTRGSYRAIFVRTNVPIGTLVRTLLYACTKFEAYAVQLVLGNRKDESVTGSTTGATEVAGVPAGGVDGDIGRSGSGD